MDCVGKSCKSCILLVSGETPKPQFPEKHIQANARQMPARVYVPCN